MSCLQMRLWRFMMFLAAVLAAGLPAASAAAQIKPLSAPTDFNFTLAGSLNRHFGPKTACGKALYANDINTTNLLSMIGPDGTGHLRYLDQTRLAEIPGGLEFVNGLLYSTNGTTTIYDLSDFRHPKVVGRAPLNLDMFGGTLAATASYDPLRLFGIAHPANVTALGEYTIPHGTSSFEEWWFGSGYGWDEYAYWPGGLVIAGKAVCSGYNGEHSYYSEWAFNHGEDIVVDQGKVFLGSTFRIIDISNPTSPTQGCKMDFEMELKDIAGGDGYACCLFGEIVKIYDIHSSYYPSRVSELVVPFPATRIYYKNNLLYLTGYDELAVASFSDPLHPVICGRVKTPFPIDQLSIGDGIVFANSYDKLSAYTYNGTKPLPPLAITGLNKPGYAWSRLKAPGRVYTDRDYLYEAPIPWGLDNQICLQPPNDDKNSTTNTISFTVNRPVRVYLALPASVTVPPSWMSGWRLHGYRIVTSVDPAPGRVLYCREFNAGPITLGPSRDPSMPLHKPMYTVVIVPRSSAAEDWLSYR